MKTLGGTGGNDTMPVLRGFDLRPTGRDSLLYGDISTVYRCNAACPSCYASAGKLAEIDAKMYGRPILTNQQWYDVIDQIAPYIRTLMFSGLGDITFQDWEFHQQLIDYALGKNLFVVIYTNGLGMDKTMARWIAKRPHLSVIGKWYHTDPKKNDRLMGVVGKHISQYCKLDGFIIPEHIALLIDEGLTKHRRLGIGNTVYQHNISAATDIWRWCRTHDIVPTFSWIVPTGWGAVTAKAFDISREEKERLTRQCWQIDRKEFGIRWKFGLGPHIGATLCEDDHMLYIGPLGDARQCSSSRQPPFGYILEDGIQPLLKKKHALDKRLARLRRESTDNPTCVCAACALAQ